MNYRNIIYIAIIILNFISFMLMGIDKGRAIKRQWRIKESTLLITSFLFGALGGLFGMLFFRHKTKHLKFIVSIPLMLIFQAVLIFKYLL